MRLVPHEENICVVFGDDIPSSSLLSHFEENTNNVLEDEVDEGPAYSWPWRTFCVAIAILLFYTLLLLLLRYAEMNGYEMK